jgi:hypothetical protein
LLLPRVGDGRRAVLQLTDAGKRLNAASAGTVESTIRATLRLVNARDRRAVHQVLELLADRLDVGSTARTMRGRARAHQA